MVACDLQGQVTLGVALEPCVTAADCSAGFFCERESCDAAMGRCLFQGVTCNGDGASAVCGCNGATYFNRCLARASGVSVASTVACEGPAAVPCTSTDDCVALGAVCVKSWPDAGLCPTDVPGQCWVAPTLCEASQADGFRACGGADLCTDLCSAISGGVPFHRCE